MTVTPRFTMVVLVVADLREATDVDRMIEGIQRADVIAAHPIARAAVAGGAPRQRLTAKDIRTIAREALWSYPHIVGTCAMGREASDRAVVRPDGRVFGMEGLYAADASVIPLPPSGSPLPTIMLAEPIAAGIAA